MSDSPEQKLLQAIRNGEIWNESPYFFPDKNLPLHVWLVNSGHETVTSPSYCFHGLNRGSSEFSIFQYTVAGQGLLEYEGKTHILKPGDAFLVHLPHDHCYRFVPDETTDHWTHFYCSFSGREANRIGRLVEANSGPVLQLNDDSECVKQCLALIRNLKEQASAVTAFQASAWLYSFLMALYADTVKKQAISRDESSITFTNRIYQFCLEHLADPNIGVEDMAKECGYSKFHFTRLFKQFTNVSFYKYLNQKRIATAEKLLADPQNSITDAALNSGFTSLSSFIRMFKIVKGCTPTEFRSMYHLHT